MLLSVSCQTEPEQPNIVFIMSDDHAYQAISAYGSVLNETPNIDRLAEEGMLFNSAFVTNSICAPSRAVILTGKYSHLSSKLRLFRFFMLTVLKFEYSWTDLPLKIRDTFYI